MTILDSTGASHPPHHLHPESRCISHPQLPVCTPPSSKTEKTQRPLPQEVTRAAAIALPTPIDSLRRRRTRTLQRTTSTMTSIRLPSSDGGNESSTDHELELLELQLTVTKSSHHYLTAPNNLFPTYPRKHRGTSSLMTLWANRYLLDEGPNETTKKLLKGRIKINYLDHIWFLDMHLHSFTLAVINQFALVNNSYVSK